MFRGGEYSTRPSPKTNRRGRESLSWRYQPHSVQVHASLPSERGNLPNSCPARGQNRSSTPAGQRPSSADSSDTPLPGEAPPRPRPAARSAPGPLSAGPGCVHPRRSEVTYGDGRGGRRDGGKMAAEAGYWRRLPQSRSRRR